MLKTDRLLRLLIAMICALVLALLSMRTWQQQIVWQNDVTLWRHVVRHNPEAKNAHNNVAASLLTRGNKSDLIEAYEAAFVAIQQDSTSPDAHLNMGVALMRMSLYEEALTYLRQSIKVGPHFAKSHFNLGQVLAALGRCEEAIESHRRALELDSGMAVLLRQSKKMFAAAGNPCAKWMK